MVGPRGHKVVGEMAGHHGIPRSGKLKRGSGRRTPLISRPAEGARPQRARRGLAAGRPGVRAARLRPSRS